MISHQDKPLILIVDDDNIIRRIVREALQVEGFNILEACDGVEALEVFSRERRITSYNVCYTKLLRDSMPKNRPLDRLGNKIRCTSLIAMAKRL